MYIAIIGLSVFDRTGEFPEFSLFPGMNYYLCDHVTFTDQAVVFDRVIVCLHRRATLIGPLFETRALIG